MRERERECVCVKISSLCENQALPTNLHQVYCMQSQAEAKTLFYCKKETINISTTITLNANERYSKGDYSVCMKTLK